MGESIFDNLTSANIASYWNEKAAERAPYLGDFLFPSVKQQSSVIEFYRGLSRAPKPLSPTALGAETIMRDRQGLDKVIANSSSYKNGKYLDEEIKLQLADLASSNNPALYRLVMSRIFSDSADLLEGAALRREIARMQLLLTGKFDVAGNGQIVSQDYKMKPEHMGFANKAPWTADGSTPVDDIQRAIDRIGEDQGTTITRAVMNRRTFRALIRNNQVKSTLLANNANTAAVAVPRREVEGYLDDEFGLEVTTYDKYYTDDNGKLQYFIPDGKVAFIPATTLGRTVFTPTPEEAEPALSKTADVAFADTGVAIVTSRIIDPVTVSTKVAERFAPTFESIDDVFIFDAFNADPKA